MKGFYENRDIYCTMFKVTKGGKKAVKAFMITDDANIIANRINHREHFERADARLSLDAAVNALKKKVPEKNMGKFGVPCEQKIQLNRWYFRE